MMPALDGKRCAETLFFDYWRQHKLQIKVARIFNTYGPRMDPNDGRVVSNFVVQALKGEDITLYGDGMQTRAFCYVDDQHQLQKLQMRPSLQCVVTRTSSAFYDDGSYEEFWELATSVFGVHSYW